MMTQSSQLLTLSSGIIERSDILSDVSLTRINVFFAEMVIQMLDKSRIDLFRAFINGIFLMDLSSLITFSGLSN